MPLLSYIQLTKPRITCFILMSTAIGFLSGADQASYFGWNTLLYALLGTGLLASGTAALNQWYERDADARMYRTKNRPVPSGRILPSSALLFGIALSVAGFAVLWLGTNRLTALLGLFTEGSYLFLYTPMKSRSPHSTTVGAIPGAMPPLIGFAAAAGTLQWEAWVLYAILFLWQFPHFYAIAWMYRDDYANAGIRMLPVVDPTNESTARRIVWFSIGLIPVSLLPKYFAMAGDAYLAGALVAGACFLCAALRVSAVPSVLRARQVLLASVVYLPVLYGLLVLDRTI